MESAAEAPPSDAASGAGPAAGGEEGVGIEQRAQRLVALQYRAGKLSRAELVARRARMAAAPIPEAGPVGEGGAAE